MEEIKTISIQDGNYPKLLKEIAGPPKNLYIRGSSPTNDLCFAIVGTRKFSPYGKQVALEIAGDLAEAGLTIVSGLAPGIDTAAHQAVVEKREPASAEASAGKAIAVLGTGVDEESIYPQSNLKLAREILQTGGALISEYPPGTRGTQFTFPQRNRIISGLSLGTLVVEAKQKSGALITADWARKQKRKIFAVPGPIYSLNSKGCHYLIKNGAKLVENANDILRELNLKLRRSDLYKTTVGENEEENLILNILKEGALDVEKIIEETKLSAQKATSILAILEIQGKVKNLGGNVFALKR